MKEIEAENEALPDDTDDLDPEGELEAWKLRELARLKRDQEERCATQVVYLPGLSLMLAVAVLGSPFVLGRFASTTPSALLRQ